MLASFFFLFIGLSLSATWTCTFRDNEGYTYDFSKVSTNASSTYGLYQAYDSSVNLYFWKLCDPAYYNGYATCDQTTYANTQVCQQGGTLTTGKSCGTGSPEPTYSYKGNGQGIIMTTTKGTPGCTSPATARSTTLNVLCASAFNRADKSADTVAETACTYQITMYLTAACGTKGSGGNTKDKSSGGGLSGGSVFLIIFFVSLFVYFAAGIGYNAYRGQQGVELVPNVEFWKDLPFLVKDGVMFCVHLVTGGGSYSSV